jgi:hypothetical protein
MIKNNINIKNGTTLINTDIFDKEKDFRRIGGH